MTILVTRSRVAAGLASLFLALTSAAAMADFPVQTADPDGV